MDDGRSRRADGFVRTKSLLPQRRTVANLFIALKRRGMRIDAHIDHAATAAAAGLVLRPEDLVVFTFPEAEGAILLKLPVLGVEFPRKILVWEDEAGEVWIGYNDPVWIGRRFGATAEAASLLRAMSTSLTGIAFEAGGQPPSA
jgi:uncharacterized protein (DUF302 family)